MIHVGDIMSTLGVSSTSEGCHKYIGGGGGGRSCVRAN